MAQFLSGRYTIHDANLLKDGVRDSISYPSYGSEKFTESYNHLSTMLKDVEIFFAPINEDFSILQRIETSMINILRDADLKYDLLDNARISRRRKLDEKEIEVNILVPEGLRGIPDVLVA